MSTKSDTPIKSPGSRALRLLSKLPSNSSRLSGELIPTALAGEIRDVARDAAIYLRGRIQKVKGANSASDTQKQLSAALSEIEALTAKRKKTESDYTRLIICERQAEDLRLATEAETSEYQEADELLNAEVKDWGQKLLSALSAPVLDDLTVAACAAIKPFCGDQNPAPFALTLPRLVDVRHAFYLGVNPHLSGVENAQKTVALIEKSLAA